MKTAKNKILTTIPSIVLIISLLVCGGCETHPPAYRKIEEKDETDGQFYFYYDDDYLHGYAITGDMEENNPEVMYLPAYYKGEEVKQVFYTTPISHFGMMQKTFGPSFKNVKKLYVAFSPLTHNFKISGVNDPCVVHEIYYAGVTLPKSEPELWHMLFERNFLSEDRIFYFQEDFLSYVVAILKNWYSISKYSVWKDFCDKTTLSNYNDDTLRSTITFYKANIVFRFNYENSPNNDVFFVDNSEYGGTIRNTPYNPIRNGYKFTGWFKEAECVNKWNFDTGTLPPVDSDEEGNVTEFIETKLYAGWQKN